jgi:hypothetical protein
MPSAGEPTQSSELRRSGIESIPKPNDCHLRGIRELSSRSASAGGNRSRLENPSLPLVI